MSNEEKLRTPKFRAAFVNVFEPKSYGESNDLKYTLAMIFDVKNMSAGDKKKWNAMLKAAQDAVKVKWGAKPPKNLKSPFLKCDDYEYDGYDEGMRFIRTNSKFAPGIVNRKNEDIISAEEFYGGCYAHADVTIYTFDVKGNRGVGIGLRSIQKLGEGEPLKSGGSAQDDFDALDVEDDDLLDEGADEVANEMFS